MGLKLQKSFLTNYIAISVNFEQLLFCFVFDNYFSRYTIFIFLGWGVPQHLFLPFLVLLDLFDVQTKCQTSTSVPSWQFGRIASNPIFFYHRQTHKQTHRVTYVGCAHLKSILTQTCFVSHYPVWLGRAGLLVENYTDLMLFKTIPSDPLLFSYSFFHCGAQQMFALIHLSSSSCWTI